MNSQTTLKIGDVVILKSGGPPMTVHNIGSYTMKGLDPGVLCVWFDNAKRVEDVFHPEALELYDMAG
jgi:uncharacterized protein YodC (DUF2158 family)